MERAPQHPESAPFSTEVSLQEKGHITGAEPPDAPAVLPHHRQQVSRKQLINKLNHLNFQDQTISVHFKHKKYDRTISIKAYPLPCHDRELVCQWADSSSIDQVLEAYRFDRLYIAKGRQLLEVVPELKSASSRQIVLLLPETCNEVSARKIRRHMCCKVTVYMFQNSALFYGELIDFCAYQFRAQVRTAPPQTFQWVDDSSPVTIILAQDSDTLYSGQCRIIKQSQGQFSRHFVLEPVHRQVRRFKPKEFRSTRQKLSPSPNVIFTHPITGKTVNLKTYDISGSGLAVEENESEAVMLAGMVIPDLSIGFSDGSTIHCMAQVVYSQFHRESMSGRILRCGIAILDMSVEDHIRLLSILHQVKDDNTYLCNRVDMDALWDFFFETGFIYPEKYEFIQANKEEIKATYEKLYTMNPSVANHFIYQENGRILGHMAMLRFYENSWLIHHHAAIRSAYNRGGLIVLNQVGRFINDSHRLFSMKMDYVFCFFRPDNKFPTHVFGGAARNIKDPKACSLDTMAYFHFQPEGSLSGSQLPPGWLLRPASAEDLLDLQTFYETESGGLMIQALNLEPERINCRQLAREYHRIGLKRDRMIMALTHQEKLAAVLVVNLADLGLNMSDLTNSISVLTVNGEGLNSAILNPALATLSRHFDQDKIPTLVYPFATAEKIGLPYEKAYSLWVLSMQHTDHYFRFLKRLLKFIQH